MAYCSRRSRFSRVGDESLLIGLQRMRRDAMRETDSDYDIGIPNSGSMNADWKAGKTLKCQALWSVFSEDYETVHSKILDPRGQVVQRWNRVFLIVCVVSLFVDPFFFYVPSVDSKYTCLGDELTLKVILTIIRSAADVFYLIQIIVRFNTAFIAPSSRVLGRGELVIDSKMIALRYLRKNFWIDIFAALPLPQVLMWIIIPNLGGSVTRKIKNVIWFILLLQFLPRLFLILLPLRSEIVNASDGLTETAWARVAYNLMFYFLGSHVSGACWYLLSIGRLNTCWRSVCDQEGPLCKFDFFNCHRVQDPSRVTWYGLSNVTTLCQPSNANTPIKWGIYGVSLVNSLPSSKFFSKFFYCLWWGLNNLSDIGQNLQASTSVAELIFVLAVADLGVVFIALLIGNMQRYLYFTTTRLDQWRMKRIDTEQWMQHRHIPLELREYVRTYDQYKWVATRGVDEEALLRELPPDLRRAVKRHLCFDLIRHVPLFDQMDERTLDAICERLKPVLFTENIILVREGDQVRQMFFIIRGHLDSWTTGNHGTGFFDLCHLGPGDFCGEELLTWALDPRPRIILPSSTRTVKAVKEVEAFCLEAEDLKFVASQFRRLHSKEVRCKFRFYSHQWRTWAACFIQSAWRRYSKAKKEAKLSASDNSPTSSERKLKPSSSFWDVYATKLIENSRKNESIRAGSTSVNQDTLQKPLDLDVYVD